jgi:hypothetical protein
MQYVPKGSQEDTKQSDETSRQSNRPVYQPKDLIMNEIKPYKIKA